MTALYDYLKDEISQMFNLNVYEFDLKLHNGYLSVSFHIDDISKINLYNLIKMLEINFYINKVWINDYYEYDDLCVVVEYYGVR